MTATRLSLLAAFSCAALGCATTSPRGLDVRVPTGVGAVEAHVELARDVPDGTRRVSFDEVLEAASQGAPWVLQAEARLRRAAAEADGAVGELLPRLGVGAGVRGIFGREIGNFATQMDGIEYARFELGVGLFYDLNVGERVAAADAAYDAHRAVEHETRDARLRARRAAGRAYFDLVMAQGMLDVVGQLASDAERLREIARARLETGVGNDADVARAEAEGARAVAAQARAIAARARASTTLAVLLGWEPETALAPAEAEVPVLRLADESLTPARERPDVAGARARADAASARATARWWSAFGPEIRAGVQPGLIGVDATDLGPTFGAWAWVGMTVGFGDVGAARAADAEAELRGLERDELESRARAEVLAASAAVRAARDALPEARRAVEALERAHRLQVAGFEEGTGTAVEVLEAQRALAEARVEFLEAILRYDDAQLELVTAAGVAVQSAER